MIVNKNMLNISCCEKGWDPPAPIQASCLVFICLFKALLVIFILGLKYIYKKAKMFVFDK